MEFRAIFQKTPFVNSVILLPHRTMFENYRNGIFQGRPVLGRPTRPETGRVFFVLGTPRNTEYLIFELNAAILCLQQLNF